MTKEFYTVPEVLEMGILPYSSIKSVRRLIRAGKIQVVRGLSDKRVRVFIPSTEVERLRQAFSATPRRQNQSMKGNLETKD